MAYAPDKSVSTLLESLGRASTPPVKVNSFGISLSSFLGSATFAKDYDSSLLVGTRELYDSWPKSSSVVIAVPGLIEAQISDQRFSRLVIDEAAFYSGPWLGAESGNQHHLATEVFNAGRIARGTGRSVYFVPLPSHAPKFDNAFIRSTCTVDFSSIPNEDLEEGAPHSIIWETLEKIVADRYGIS